MTRSKPLSKPPNLGTGEKTLFSKPVIISGNPLNSLRFVLYQMSKNLNRSFFMDFLSQVSLRFVDEVEESDEDNDTGRRKVFLLSNHMARPVFQHDQIDLPMTQGIAGIAVKYHLHRLYFPITQGTTSCLCF